MRRHRHHHHHCRRSRGRSLLCRFAAISPNGHIGLPFGSEYVLYLCFGVEHWTITRRKTIERMKKRKNVVQKRMLSLRDRRKLDRRTRAMHNEHWTIIKWKRKTMYEFRLFVIVVWWYARCGCHLLWRPLSARRSIMIPFLVSLCWRTRKTLYFKFLALSLFALSFSFFSLSFRLLLSFAEADHLVRRLAGLKQFN